MNFVMNHAPGAGSIALVVDLQLSAMLLCYDCPKLHKAYGGEMAPGLE